MIVTVHDVDLIIPEPVTPRTPGVHLSACLRGMAIQGGLLKDEDVEELALCDFRTISDPVAIIRICMGLAWEEWYLPQLKRIGVIDHPGELKLDGIYLTPDGESIDYVVSQKTAYELLSNIVHEVKCTYKSTKTVGELRTARELYKQWMWLAQLKAYCKASNSLHGWLHVLFVNGDYSFPMRPKMRLFKITFEPEELDENWRLITDYRDYRMEDQNYE